MRDKSAGTIFSHVSLDFHTRFNTFLMHKKAFKPILSTDVTRVYNQLLRNNVHGRINKRL